MRTYKEGLDNQSKSIQAALVSHRASSERLLGVIGSSNVDLIFQNDMPDANSCAFTDLQT